MLFVSRFTFPDPCLTDSVFLSQEPPEANGRSRYSKTYIDTKHSDVARALTVVRRYVRNAVTSPVSIRNVATVGKEQNRHQTLHGGPPSVAPARCLVLFLDDGVEEEDMGSL